MDERYSVKYKSLMSSKRLKGIKYHIRYVRDGDYRLFFYVNNFSQTIYAISFT
ncbi:hypothetical protein HYY72_04900 [Candidatus Woesearchaeota archaeon]|nr:hypothetical protein [Candidatus Woesearchaeota archaeon]